MTRLRFQFLVGLLLIAALLTFGSIFFRFTAQVAREMPRESVQMLEQSIRQVEKKHNKSGTTFVKKFINFVKNIKKNTAKKKKSKKETLRR